MEAREKKPRQGGRNNLEKWKNRKVARRSGVGGRIGNWGLGEKPSNKNWEENLATKIGRNSLKRWEGRRKTWRQGNHLMAL